MQVCEVADCWVLAGYVALKDAGFQKDEDRDKTRDRLLRARFANILKGSVDLVDKERAFLQFVKITRASMVDRWFDNDSPYWRDQSYYI